MSEIVPVDATRPDPEIIRRACALLEAGELVGVPTETVYGIACSPEHIEALYCAKERDRGKPIARLAASLEQVEALGADFGKDGRALAEKYWPGPLTLVLNTPDGPTGFRVPDHNVPLALARAFGRPIALTSANKSGDANAANAQEAFHCFQPLEPAKPGFRASPSSDDASFQPPVVSQSNPLGNPVALYLDPFQPLEKTDSNFPTLGKAKQSTTQLLPTIGKKPSTVVQCLPAHSGVEGENGTKILREGAVSIAEITSLL